MDVETILARKMLNLSIYLHSVLNEVSLTLLPYLPSLDFQSLQPLSHAYADFDFLSFNCPFVFMSYDILSSTIYR